MTKDELAKAIDLHAKWLRGDSDGIRADLSDADLCWANLIGADLRGANLRWTNLSDANLSDANLRFADLSGADLSGAVLSGAVLSDADMSNANLIGADLRNADLCWANLIGANMSWANLSGADLSNAKLPLNGNKKMIKDDIDRRINMKYVTTFEDGNGSEATAAAYGAAADIAHEGALATEDDGVAAWVRDRIKAQTPQSARDWLTEREAEAYRKGQEDMRELAAKSCKNDDFAGDNKIGPGAWASALIRTLPIKERSDE